VWVVVAKVGQGGPRWAEGLSLLEYLLRPLLLIGATSTIPIDVEKADRYMIRFPRVVAKAVTLTGILILHLQKASRAVSNSKAPMTMGQAGRINQMNQRREEGIRIRRPACQGMKTSVNVNRY
jgi:hypothetical protein